MLLKSIGKEPLKSVKLVIYYARPQDSVELTTNTHPIHVSSREVTIELTPEQLEKIQPRIVGVCEHGDGGLICEHIVGIKPIFEFNE